MTTKQDLYYSGSKLVREWCRRNKVTAPSIDPATGDPKQFGTCAYYRADVIYIDISACATVSNAPMNWSLPGYVVDRTPFGVLCHELGHHVDRAEGTRGGEFSRAWYQQTLEPPLTSYHPNILEWFAEIFRLFVTNPSLLVALRPRTARLLLGQWPHVVETRAWKEVLAGSPRHLKAAQRKIEDTLKREARGETRRLF